MPPAAKEGNGAGTLEISGMLIPAAEEREGEGRKRKVFGWDSERGGQWGDDAWPLYQQRTCDGVSKEEEDNLIYWARNYYLLWVA